MRAAFAFAGALLLMTLPAEAFAQAGSTGGTLGKSNKSVAGERGTEDSEQKSPRASHAAHQPTAEKSSSCQRVVGAWNWFIGPTVTFKDDGTGGNSLFTFTRTCSGGNYVLIWSHGYTDRVKLSADGKSLDGKNQNGTHIFASRQ